MFKKLEDYLMLNYVWATPERAMRIYESVPDHVLHAFRLSNLKKTLKHAREKSIFYSKCFHEHPIDIDTIQSPSDLDHVFTAPKDLQTIPASHFLCEKANTAFETTGTVSKKSKRIYFSKREIEDAGRVGAAGLTRLGITQDDRVASSFDYSFWVSGPTLKNSLDVIGCFHIEAGRIDPEEFYDRIKPYGCNVIVADPGWLVRLSEIAEKRGPWLMKLMIAGGENLSESAREYVQNVWQCKLFLSYGQTEAFGMIGMECPAQKGYQINDMDLWFEIPNPDEYGYGELVYTTLRRTVMPLIRYKSGDVTRFINESCECGSRCRRIAKLKGRADEMAVTGVGNIASWMFDPIIEKFDSRIYEWQLKLAREGMKDTLLFQAEMANSVNGHDLREKILNQMNETMSVAVNGIRQGLVDFEVKVFEPGKLKGDQRKLKRILDERQFA